jgi:hypothetical protein
MGLKQVISDGHSCHFRNSRPRYGSTAAMGRPRLNTKTFDRD